MLILDEPGNDMDTDMLAAIEELLDAWPGTLLLVTHDRYLMERVTDNQYALINGKIRHLPRGVDEYLELVGRTTDERGGVVASSSGKASASKQPSRRRASRRQARRRSSRVARSARFVSLWRRLSARWTRCMAR